MLPVKSRIPHMGHHDGEDLGREFFHGILEGLYILPEQLLLTGFHRHFILVGILLSLSQPGEMFQGSGQQMGFPYPVRAPSTNLDTVAAWWL